MNTKKTYAREEVKYSLVFPATPRVEYKPVSRKTYCLVCYTVKEIKS